MPSFRPTPLLSALARYTQQDFIDLVDRHGLNYHEKTLGQLFCDDSAKDIVDILLTECDWAGVTLQFQTEILTVSKTDEGFVLDTSKGRSPARRWWSPPAASPCRNSVLPPMASSWRSSSASPCCRLAPGWCPLPCIRPTRRPSPIWRGQPAGGGDRRGWHPLPRRPCCSPIAASPAPPSCRSPLLAGGEKIHINLLPDLDIPETLKTWVQAHPAQELKTVLGRELPKRFVDKLVELGWLVSKPMRQYNERELEAVATLLGIGRSCPTAPKGIAPPK